MKIHKFFFVIVVLVVVFLMFFFAVVRPQFFAGVMHGMKVEDADVVAMSMPAVNVERLMVENVKVGVDVIEGRVMPPMTGVHVEVM